MNKIFLYTFLFFCSISFAQNNINSYKYILIPKQFEFQKSIDEYQINSLSKFLFEKAGFDVLFTDEPYPSDLANNSCLGLKVKLNNNSSLFKTKMNIDLQDCFNKVVFSIKEGTSRNKEYKKAYQEALRAAFIGVDKLGYKYKATALGSEHNDGDKNVEIKKEVVVTEIAQKKLILLKDENKINPSSLKSIEGKFNFENWGKVVISKREDYFSVVGGDENFQFATIYKTSKSSIFIIKWASFKQPQLLEIDIDGNLKVDSKEGVKLFKRIH